MANGWPVERVELFFELFWEYRLALNLLSRIVNAGKRASAEMVEPWFRDTRAASLHEGTFEFLLLAMEKTLAGESEVDRRLLVDLCRSALRSEQLPGAAVWFAGGKAAQEFQRVLTDVAREDGTGTGRRALFAFITFIGELESGVVEPQTRLALLRSHYAEIGLSRLDQYFVYVIARLLKEVAADDSDARWLACVEQGAGAGAGTIAQTHDQASGSSSLKRRDKRRQTLKTMDSLCDRAASTHYCCHGLDGLRRR
jgi:hypothetical protein